MKKIYALTLFMFLFLNYSFSQSQRPISATEKQMTDSLCGCVSKLDIAKVTTADEALKQYTTCVGKYVDILQALANERHIEFSDNDGMRNIGIDLAKDLMKNNCGNFTMLSVLMAKSDKGDDEPAIQSTAGVFKRVDLKGFNYLIIEDQNSSEKSFLWLRQFPGSEQFMNGTAKLAGKKVKVSWQEIEVYLPAAKGYYKVKEITGVELL